LYNGPEEGQKRGGFGESGHGCKARGGRRTRNRRRLA
jgi:hypothetical protein